jgi:hypothetical protein
MAQHYKDLIAWQKAMDLVAALYDATEAFPQREITVSPIRCAGRPFPSRAISPRGKHTTAIVNFVTFFVTRADL